MKKTSGNKKNNFLPFFAIALCLLAVFAIGTQKMDKKMDKKSTASPMLETITSNDDITKPQEQITQEKKCEGREWCRINYVPTSQSLYSRGSASIYYPQGWTATFKKNEHTNETALILKSEYASIDIFDSQESISCVFDSQAQAEGYERNVKTLATFQKSAQLQWKLGTIADSNSLVLCEQIKGNEQGSGFTALGEIVIIKLEGTTRKALVANDVSTEQFNTIKQIIEKIELH